MNAELPLCVVPQGDKGDKGERGYTTTLKGDAFPTGIIEGPPGPPGPPGTYPPSPLSAGMRAGCSVSHRCRHGS